MQDPPLLFSESYLLSHYINFHRLEKKPINFFSIKSRKREKMKGVGRNIMRKKDFMFA